MGILYDKVYKSLQEEGFHELFEFLSLLDDAINTKKLDENEKFTIEHSIGMTMYCNFITRDMSEEALPEEKALDDFYDLVNYIACAREWDAVLAEIVTIPTKSYKALLNHAIEIKDYHNNRVVIIGDGLHLFHVLDDGREEVIHLYLSNIKPASETVK